MKKKLLLLGGSRYLLPVIRTAHELGLYVITCDYLPNNIAHKFSDEYVNASVIDKERMLEVARQLKIDGIMSFACDPGVVTAAYVAEKLGLPTSPYKSVELLQNKGHFRNFLMENGFNVPKACSYRTAKEALAEADGFQWPVIVKPVDSAGSKGVKRVEKVEYLADAAENALNYSISKEFIVEEFIEKTGFSSDTESFSINGELVFCSFNDQWFDPNANNPYTPSGFLWPSSLPDHTQQELRSELQRLIKLLDMNTTIYNVETRLGTNGKAYIMECSPRAGGNRLSELLKLACGQNIIEASINASLGLPIKKMTDPVYQGHWGEVILHSNVEGKLQNIVINKEFAKNCITELDLWVKPGDTVQSFSGANDTIGTAILHCDSRQELVYMLENADKLVKIEVET